MVEIAILSSEGVITEFRNVEEYSSTKTHHNGERIARQVIRNTIGIKTDVSIIVEDVLIKPTSVEITTRYQEPSIDILLNQKLDEIDKYSRDYRNSLVANISPAEMSSWFHKYREATDYLREKNPLFSPILTIEARSRGISLPELCTKVVQKASKYFALEAHIAGVTGKHQDTIRLLAKQNKISELSNYNYNTGWLL